MDISNEYFITTAKGEEDYCAVKGYEFVVWDGAGDAMKQVNGLENLVSAGCSVIDLRAIDAKAVADAVGEAVSKGVFVNTYPNVENRTTWMHYDEYDQGYLMATVASEWVNKKFNGTAELAYLTIPENEAVMRRIDGCRDAFTKLCPGVVEVGSQAALVPDEGMNAAESLMQAHPNLKLILATSDAAATGAYEAAVAAAKTGDDFFIGGVDGDPAAINYIKENGPYKVSIAGAYLNEEAAWVVLDNIVNAYLGKPFKEEVKLEIIAVTFDNVEEYLSRINGKPDYESLGI